jgi:hypothetical protein
MNQHQLSWKPSEEASRKALGGLGLALLVVGAIAFSLSFDSVMVAARPVFGMASWAAPILLDTAIGILVLLGLVLELNGLRARLPRLAGNLLVGLTIYANVAPAHGVYAKVLHGAPPAVWVVIVTIVEGAVRKLVGLSDENRIEGIRRSLWVLRPFGTLRLWRAMRIHQITTYKAALDRDAARAVVVGRLRLHHGRMWRSKAPLAERIALRLDGRDPQGVAEALTRHQETAALLAGTSEPEPETVTVEALAPLDPVVYPKAERPVLSSFAEPNALGFPFSPGVKALPVGATPAGPENAPENDVDDAAAAARMRDEGLSYEQIGRRLNRSKSWAWGAVNARQVEHANGFGD